MRAYEVRETTGLDGLHLNANRAEPVPGPGQVLVRMRAAALNYRDQGVIKGAYGYTRFPVVPMSDGAGEVVQVGPGVTQFMTGDRVAGTFFVNWIAGRIPADASKNSLGGMVDGVLAEYVLLNETGAIKIPDHLSFEEAATLPCAALTAWHAVVEAGRIKAGETIAILGTGGVACFALAFAKMHGAVVTMTSSSDDKLARVKALGVDTTVNYKTNPDWEQDVLRQTGGAGVDHIVEVGGANTLSKSMLAIRPGGAIYVIGALGGAGSIDPRMINRKSIRLQGIHVGSRDMFAAMNRAIANAHLKPVIDRVFEFKDAKAAYAYQQSGGHMGKIVVAI
ncbi:MAG: NAD(P)-dependent alcohol dehydrogenase [Pseudolabrys sp.]|nr:NAD(P)-dependent alcohol dehydrogenase [Pseudolabrys sp.]MDP2296154.1 NAD(P)-dependent alcohol dehydrogenase [Pseudolabrys sp.]